MNTKKLVIFVGLLIIGLYLTGCGPLPAEWDAEATPVVANLAAIQTAEAPTATSSPTHVPPTNTPQPPTPTDTPAPPPPYTQARANKYAYCHTHSNFDASC